MDGEYTFLFIEDDPEYLTFYTDEASGHFPGASILIADNLSIALHVMNENIDRITVIVFDGCLYASTLNTIPLIQHGAQLRSSGRFQGKMIAASRDAAYRAEMVEAGCDYDTPKSGVVELLCETLSK